MSWTPNGLFLVVCDKNTVVQEVMGSDLWHVGSYSEWDSGSAAVSGKLRTMPFNSMQSRLKCFVLCWFDVVHLFTIHFLVVWYTCLHASILADIVHVCMLCWLVDGLSTSYCMYMTLAWFLISLTTGISGYSSMQFTSMFEKEFNVLPNQYAASAFAGKCCYLCFFTFHCYGTIVLSMSMMTWSTPLYLYCNCYRHQLMILWFLLDLSLLLLLWSCTH